MTNKDFLLNCVYEALKENNGSASILDVSKNIYKKHKKELKLRGNLYFTWQYDFRWAATKLRKKGIMKNKKDSPRGIWELEK